MDHPCQNGGTCIADAIKCEPRCRCADAWTGRHCEVSSRCTDAAIERCGEHGECVDDVDYTHCRCKPGWVGRTCQERGLTITDYYQSTGLFKDSDSMGEQCEDDLELLIHVQVSPDQFTGHFFHWELWYSPEPLNTTAPEPQLDCSSFHSIYPGGHGLRNGSYRPGEVCDGMPSTTTLVYTGDVMDRAESGFLYRAGLCGLSTMPGTFTFVMSDQESFMRASFWGPAAIYDIFLRTRHTEKLLRHGGGCQPWWSVSSCPGFVPTTFSGSELTQFEVQPHCQTDGPCGQHGSCVEGGDTYVCECETGWGGVTCEEVDSCSENSCAPGQTCQHINATTQRCVTCASDYFGREYCSETCGDGVIDHPAEQCDDGNDVVGDGCSCPLPDWVGTKQYVCLGQPSLCALTNASDAAALLDLVGGADGLQPGEDGLTGSAVSEWVGEDPCYRKWNGVFCVAGRVIALGFADWSGVANRGGLTESLGRLSEITDTWWLCKISGTIPASIANMKKLSYLHIGYPRRAAYGEIFISGTLPAAIGNMDSLAFFAQIDSRISGSLPVSIWDAARLNWLELTREDISGTLPVEWRTTVETVRLDGCKLSGSLPMNINVPKMKALDLFSNYLTGGLQGFVADNSSAPALKTLTLSNNRLEATIPDRLFAKMRRLRYLRLFDAALSGTIPQIHADNNATRLRKLDLNQNFLSGTIPAALGVTSGHNFEQLFGYSTNMVPTANTTLDGDSVVDTRFVERLADDDLADTAGNVYRTSRIAHVSDRNLASELYVEKVPVSLLMTWPADFCAKFIRIFWSRTHAAKAYTVETLGATGRFSILADERDMHEGNFRVDEIFIGRALEAIRINVTAMHAGKANNNGQSTPDSWSVLEIEVSRDDDFCVANPDYNVASHSTECQEKLDDVAEACMTNNCGDGCEYAACSALEPPSLGECYADNGECVVQSFQWKVQQAVETCHLPCHVDACEIYAHGHTRLGVRLGSNSLSGTIPDEVYNLELETFELWGNKISGTLSDAISNIFGANHMYIHRNQISGTLPPRFGDVGSNGCAHSVEQTCINEDSPVWIDSILRTIDISSNKVSGSLPTFFADSGLRILRLFDNMFDRELPADLLNLSSLVTLDVQNNPLAISNPTDDPEYSGVKSASLEVLSQLAAAWAEPGKMSDTPYGALKVPLGNNDPTIYRTELAPYFSPYRVIAGSQFDFQIVPRELIDLESCIGTDGDSQGCYHERFVQESATPGLGFCVLLRELVSGDSSEQASSRRLIQLPCEDDRKGKFGVHLAPVSQDGHVPTYVLAQLTPHILSVEQIKNGMRQEVSTLAEMVPLTEVAEYQIILTRDRPDTATEVQKWGDTLYERMMITHAHLLVEPADISARHSTVQDIPTSIRAGQTEYVLLQARDIYANLIVVGGRGDQIQARSVADDSITHNVTDNYDGTYRIGISLPRHGQYTFSVDVYQTRLCLESATHTTAVFANRSEGLYLHNRECEIDTKDLRVTATAESCGRVGKLLSGVECICAPGYGLDGTESSLCILCQPGEVSAGRECEACGAGQQPNSNRSACGPCDAGSISTAGVCTQCGPGQQPNEQQNSCDDCPDGSSGVSGICAPCPSGRASNLEKTSCESCDEYSAGVNGECNLCLAGTKPRTDRTACETCPIGTAGYNGACNLCPVGTQPNNELTSCEDCPVGSAGTQGTCTDCADGTQANSARSSCEACPAARAGTNGICQLCVAGKQPNVNSTHCVDCSPGRAGSTGACDQCQAGTQPNNELTSCEDCPVGSAGTQGTCTDCADGTQANSARSSCEACPAARAGTNGICQLCVAGKQPNVNSTHCVDCSPGRAGSTGACDQCQAGTQPNNELTSCEECDEFSAGTSGVCTQCAPGTEPNDLHTNCISCPAGKASVGSGSSVRCEVCASGKVSNQYRTACVCKRGLYNTELIGTVKCHSGIRSAWVAPETDDQCWPCPDCMDCVAETPTLRTGWSFYPPAGSGHAYVCPVHEGCPSTPLTHKENTTTTNCAVGYDGPVCGDCSADYNHLTVGKVCESCRDGVINIPLVLGVFFSGLTASVLVISGAARALQDYGLVTDLRIMVGFLQILSQASMVLDLRFPSPIPELMELVSLMLGDVRDIVRMDCWNIGGFYGKFVTNVIAVPTVIFTICFALFQNQKRTIEATIRGGGASESARETAQVQLRKNVFFGIFMVYPTVTTTLFRVPQCRILGNDRYHEDDYRVRCDNSDFYSIGALSACLIVLVPLGVPTIFFFMMKRQKDKIGGVRETALGGAKLADDDTADEDDRYGLLIRDFRPEFYFYEIVTYSRKLLLGGVTVMMGRGTMAQVSLAQPNSQPITIFW
eukprot:COSAG02_NODE_1575_length_11877_cov_43.830871_5_plen_2345_part_00